MTLVSMQPYFFPYLGYFDLANRADVWVAYDTPQHMAQGWVHRNRVLHPLEGWQYVIVPLQKHSHTTPINKLEVAATLKWKERIFGQLTHYRKEAPFYRQTIEFLRECLCDCDGSVAQLNIKSFRLACQRLQIGVPIHVFSEICGTSEDGKTPEETAIDKCLHFQADQYLNPSGGAMLYSEDHFAKHGIKLTIQRYEPMVYGCGSYVYEPRLSIIDVMMWNSLESIKAHLNTLRTTA